MPKEDNGLRGWLYNNSWNLIVTFTGILLVFSLLNAKVDNTVVAVSSLQTKLDKYPSEQYFDLKFEVQEEKLVALERKVDEISLDLKKHLQVQ